MSFKMLASTFVVGVAAFGCFLLSGCRQSGGYYDGSSSSSYSAPSQSYSAPGGSGTRSAPVGGSGTR
ncbi:hypothetical protein FF011L_26830 [Roseimaritima multifibrata]|uniref:Lipoprotein n=1 Tax=Roseimaritima multifibrata TaxID=1930274 RepID=A0A517MGB1_9BACT|nr:hypothetical protein FF011L_26830 [Roseimaritima multifibrata]